MNKKLIAIILISASFVTFFAYVFYQTFYKYQSDVDQILAEIPAEDKELPPNVLKVLQNTLNFRNKKSQVVINIFLKVKEKRELQTSVLERIFHELVWQIALPIRLSKKDFCLLIANKSYLRKDIYNFKSGAKFFFNKNWSDLTEEEILVLVAISHSPEFIRNRNSEYSNKIINELTETYQKNLTSSW